MSQTFSRPQILKTKAKIKQLPTNGAVFDSKTIYGISLNASANKYFHRWGGGGDAENQKTSIFPPTCKWVTRFTEDGQECTRRTFPPSVAGVVGAKNAGNRLQKCKTRPRAFPWPGGGDCR